MIKSLTFTIMHFIIAFTVAYLLTGDWAIGGLIALVEPLVNSVGYFFHEKVWERFYQAKSATSNNVNGFNPILHP